MLASHNETIFFDEGVFMIKSNNDVLGIDIGSSLIKMAQVTLGKSTELVKMGYVENPVPKFSSEQSAETDRELVKAIKSCYRQNDFSTKRASLCLSEPSAIFRDARLPEMKNEEILENIKYEISEYFSIDIDQYTVTYRILAKEENEGRVVLRVLGVAVPSSLIARYVRILRKAGLKPAYMDVATNAYLKMMKRMKKDISQEQAVCIMDYGHAALTISVFDNGIPFVTREVAMDWEVDNFDTVATVLSQVLDYYYSRNYTSHIQRVWVSGGNGYINDFCQYVSMQTGVQVEVVRPDMFDIINKAPEDVPMGIYFKAIGAAIREELAI
jgi:Tfp pilus assembly PilM family ATPase